MGNGQWGRGTPPSVVSGKAALEGDLSKDLKEVRRERARRMGERASQAQQSRVLRQVHEVCPRSLGRLGWSAPEDR